MKKTIGIFAHVDAGKTTLSEQILYNTGAIRTLGRVDDKNTLLDTNKIERDRGITIYSDVAEFKYGESEYYLAEDVYKRQLQSGCISSLLLKDLTTPR